MPVIPDDWASVPGGPDDRAVPLNDVGNASGVRNEGFTRLHETVKKTSAKLHETVKRNKGVAALIGALLVVLVLLVVVWLQLYVLQRHADAVGPPRRPHGASPERAPGETGSAWAKFPSGMPERCQLQHLDKPRQLHMASTPGQSSKSFKVEHVDDGSVSLKTSRGLYLVAHRETRNILLQKDIMGKKNSSEDSVVDGHFTAFHQGECQVSLRTSSGYFVSALGDGMLDASYLKVGAREIFDTCLNPDGTVALRMWDGTYLDAEQLMQRDHRYAVASSEVFSSKALFRTLARGKGEVALASWYGTYLSVDPDGTITANCTNIERSERFTIEHVSGDPLLIALKTSSGKYVEIANRRVVATSKKTSTCGTFNISETSGSYMGLKSCHLHISVERVPIYTFLGYRAVSSDDKFQLKNVNIGNLAGVMWYLHNEVVVETPNKFGISRIVRARFRVTAPDKLLSIGMHFGVRFSYDAGMCNGFGVGQDLQGKGSCDPFYKKYGFFVGCNYLNHFPFPMPSQGYPNHYRGARWYSLPAESFCGEGDIVPTGEPDCIYSYELAGEIDISELAGIKDYDAFIRQGGREYERAPDVGKSCGFWDQKFSTDHCDERLKAARHMFAKKHPDTPQDELDDQEPPCDFDCYRFYDGDPPDLCNETLQAEVAAGTHPMSAPEWTWDYGMNVSGV
ncbi:unnamed protein product [Prorocentrum cordatum]|uniref:Beta-galactosidase n=1 Tax=Prorocentrum cordatum TaxID=2364126 RepID=A0ABN9TD81_9DINO|nr:unnamed protein product [Polarella glacialis]